MDLSESAQQPELIKVLNAISTSLHAAHEASILIMRQATRKLRAKRVLLSIEILGMVVILSEIVAASKMHVNSS